MRSRACGSPSDDWSNSGYGDALFRCGECGFGSWGSSLGSPILRNGYGILGQKVSSSEISAG